LKTLLFGGLLLLVCTQAVNAQRGGGRDRYDDTFRKYSKRFFGVGFDWQYFKAQGLAESGLDPNARSRVGARGIMQLMPGTYAMIKSRRTDLGEIDDPEWNIAAGIMHSRGLWHRWEDVRQLQRGRGYDSAG
jgi:membrane-bound lytic murein transglycosylase F